MASHVSKARKVHYHCGSAGSKLNPNYEFHTFLKFRTVCVECCTLFGLLMLPTNVSILFSDAGSILECG